MVSLGTTDRKQALRICVGLTAYMDLMLDDDLHISLPKADVSAFLKAELRCYLRSLKAKRIVEHVDGSMTSAKARRNNLEAVVLNGLSEDGLRKEIPQARLAALSPVLRNEAADIQRAKYSEFISVEFNQGVEKRARAELGVLPFTDYDKLFLRKAAIDAQMAAHNALEAVHVHSVDTTRAAALDLLTSLVSAVPTGVSPVANQPNSQAPALHSTPKAAPLLSQGVELIKGAVTSQTIARQRDQAFDQPEDQNFDGLADNAVTERVYGADLFGTAVRMARKSRAQDDTNQQKFKSVGLFIYLTGIQMVTDIRQHHLDMFANALENELPKFYWKSTAEKNLTFKELLEVNRNRSKDIVGLSSPTIERHLATMRSIIDFADDEGNKAPFTPRISHLIPPDKRSDTEKRSVYTLDDARRVFQHPLWQGCKSKGRRHTAGPLVIKDHHYWINLLLAYTGARRSEIAGLLDVDIGQKNDIPFLHIRENYLRGLKNRFSQRRISLHAHLVDLGFLDFVDAKRSSNEAVLFPEAIHAKSRKLSLANDGAVPPYDKKFGDALDHVWRECLTRSLNGNPEKYCLASLRGFVNNTCINLRAEDGNTLLVPEIDRRDILGHKPINVNEANYRRQEKPLGPLYVAIKLLPKLF
jgi:integrase